jgi:O-antigen ligase
VTPSSTSAVAAGRPAPAVPDHPEEPGPRLDDWPHTTRILPWLVAAFLTLIWAIPFDSAELPISLPFESKLDRFVLAALAGVWLFVVARGAPGTTRPVSGWITVAIGALMLVTFASVVLNFDVLARIGESEIAVKKLSLILSLALFFLVVASSIRATEVGAFITLMIGLAALAGLGTVVEYRTGVNHFFGFTDAVIPGVSVAPPPIDPDFGRAAITGPTSHGLAITAILAMVLPFAVARLFQVKDALPRALYMLAVVLILAGGVATLRKTALVAPVAALLVLLAYRPRSMARLLPLGIVFVVGIHFLAPGALGGIRKEFEGRSQASTQGRTSDYAAVTPDVLAYPVLGRGFGTYDPKNDLIATAPYHHRTLDNQYLMLLIEIGIVGLLVYVAVALVGWIALHPSARSSDPARAGPALGAIGALMAYLVSNFLFDTLAFPQAPYMFFFVLALAAVWARAHAHEAVPQAQTAPPPATAGQAAAWRAAPYP